MAGTPDWQKKCSSLVLLPFRPWLSVHTGAPQAQDEPRKTALSAGAPEASLPAPWPRGTWVVERHQHVTGRLHGAATPLLHDAASLDFGGIDLLAHATRGVQDEAQAGGRGQVQQPEEQRETQ